MCLKGNERSNQLYLIVFKPYRPLYLHPFESYQVKTKMLIKISSNRMDAADCPSKSPERAITRYTDQTSYWQYVYPMVG